MKKYLRFLKHKKTITPLPYPYYFIPVVIIALIGFCDSIYLTISHYRNYVDMGYQSFCAVSRTLNCDTVSQSPYSIFLNVPVPVWGVLGYGFYIFLLVFAGSQQALKKRVWTLLFLIGFVFSTYSLILAFISSYYIRSYCIMCILSYLVNLALLFYTWIIRNRFACESFIAAIQLDFIYLKGFAKIVLPVTLLFMVGSVTLVFTFPPYWHMQLPDLASDMPTGITQSGHPWIGAENPELVITEFSDYRCFQCKKMHYFLRRLIENYPDKIRLVHRHFPMDHTINPLVKEPFHPGAAKLAIVALFAQEKGKFWEMNDLFFAIPRNNATINIRQYASETGLDSEEIKRAFLDKTLWLKLNKDISEGLEMGITGTPGFVVDGQVYLAQLPAEILEAYLD